MTRLAQETFLHLLTFCLPCAAFERRRICNRPAAADHALSSAIEEDTMDPKQFFVAASAALILVGTGPANAEQTIDEAATMACVNDKWDETEPEKGHKLVDFAGRCINVPNDPNAPKSAGDCVGKYEFMPDGSWKAAGTCIYSFKGGDTLSDAWEEGSHLKEYTYKYTGGTGKFEGASGGGTYMYENITDTLAGGRFKGQLVLP